MPEKKDYYEVLGVPREASEKDIKSSYRKLAMKYHPDRSDAPDTEERFKEISEAYAVLSDSDKRRQYDQFGHAGINSQYSQEDLFRGVNFEDIFRGFGFGGDSIFDMFFGGGRRRGTSRGNDLRYDLDMTLEQVASGLETTIEVPRAESCPTCAGSGAKPGYRPSTLVIEHRSLVIFFNPPISMPRPLSFPVASCYSKVCRSRRTGGPDMAHLGSGTTSPAPA